MPGRNEIASPISEPVPTTGPGKTVFIKTYGCQMNVYDSQRIVETLASAGYKETDSAETADLVVLNTCHIRERAADKVYSALGRLRDLTDGVGPSGERRLVAVAGCVAQAEGNEIARRVPNVDVIVGPQSYHRLPELLTLRAVTRKTAIDVDLPILEKFAVNPTAKRKSTPSAFLTIQEGCDKFCTFCVVPYTRGSEYSRPVAHVVDEARRLVDGGARELVLLGQNVNAYNGADATGNRSTLSALLYRLATVSGVARLRYMTSHPNDMTDDLIAAHGELPQLMPFLHLPFQSGSDRILKAMNRNHTVEHYIRIIDRVRAARSDMALSTDIIVGFPGETDDDFDQTIKIVREIGFAQSFSFKYSPRPGTPAAEKANQVPESVMAHRLEMLQNLLKSQQIAFNQATVGKTVEVLWENATKAGDKIVGRSPHMQLVQAEGSHALLGSCTAVEIVSAGLGSLAAVIK